MKHIPDEEIVGLNLPTAVPYVFEFDNDLNLKKDYFLGDPEKIKKLMEAIKKTNLYFVIVSNEVGMGIVPENKLSRIYADFVGRANQLIAKYSDEVYFVVSGIPMKVK